MKFITITQDFSRFKEDPYLLKKQKLSMLVLFTAASPLSFDISR